LPVPAVRAVHGGRNSAAVTPRMRRYRSHLPPPDCLVIIPLNPDLHNFADPGPDPHLKHGFGSETSSNEKI